jgi:P27 family predicted phage terminase small subunit
LLHQLHGTARKDRNSNPLEPMPLGDLSEPPSWMTDAQQDGWRYAIQHCPKGLLKLLDRGVLTLWVEAEDRHRSASMAQARLNERGKDLPFLVQSPLGLEVSPYVEVIDKAAKIMFRCISEMGFSPASRPRLRLVPDDADTAKQAQADPWATLRLIPGGKAS